jgi:hypothetical protein
MIIMANTYCHKGYCEPAEEENSKMEISDKVIIGGFILAMIVFSAILWYGASIGIYVDPASLN